MRRRDFLSRLAIGAGALSVSGSGAFAQDAGGRSGPPRTNPGETVEEPARKIPVVARADVLVVGAGPAGVAAAIAAARAGSGTILVERYNHLGGLWTGGLVLPLLATHGTDRGGRRQQVIHGIGGEMARRLADMKMSIHEVDPVVDPEAAKYVMEVMVRDAGVKPLYHCWAGNALLEDNAIKAVLIESKTGRVAVAPKVVVDCTGDGDIAHFAGESYQTMRYHIGLVSRVGNVDRVDTKRPGYRRMPIGNPTPLKSVNWLNMHGDSNQDGLDLFNLSRLQQKYRISVWEHMEKVRATPGHEEIFLLDTASQLGVRVSRILDGQYRLTLEDSMTHRTFDDAIGVSGGWTSVVHGGARVPAKDRPMWQIPYRSLVPKKTRNLLVAGRCFCFEKSLVEDTRVIGTCLVTGHGAGVAASVAAATGTSVQAVDVARVRKVLLEQKAWLG